MYRIAQLALIGIIIITIVVVGAGIITGNNQASGAVSSRNSLPLGYSAEFIEIEGLDCLAVYADPLKTDLRAMDCDFRR